MGKRKLVFKDSSSGTIMHFPFVGDWKCGVIKEFDNDKHADTLLKFRCIEEIKDKSKKKKNKKVMADEISDNFKEILENEISEGLKDLEDGNVYKKIK